MADERKRKRASIINGNGSCKDEDDVVKVKLRRFLWSDKLKRSFVSALNMTFSCVKAYAGPAPALAALTSLRRADSLDTAGDSIMFCCCCSTSADCAAIALCLLCLVQVACVMNIGLEHSTPRLLFSRLQHEDLTTEHIKSHLQKWRSRSKAEVLQMLFSLSTDDLEDLDNVADDDADDTATAASQAGSTCSGGGGGSNSSRVAAQSRLEELSPQQQVEALLQQTKRLQRDFQRQTADNIAAIQTLQASMAESAAAAAEAEASADAAAAAANSERDAGSINDALRSKLVHAISNNTGLWQSGLLPEDLMRARANSFLLTNVLSGSSALHDDSHGFTDELNRPVSPRHSDDAALPWNTQQQGYSMDMLLNPLRSSSTSQQQQQQQRGTNSSSSSSHSHSGSNLLSEVSALLQHEQQQQQRAMRLPPLSSSQLSLQQQQQMLNLTRYPSPMLLSSVTGGAGSAKQDYAGGAAAAADNSHSQLLEQLTQQRNRDTDEQHSSDRSSGSSSAAAAAAAAAARRGSLLSGAYQNSSSNSNSNGCGHADHAEVSARVGGSNNISNGNGNSNGNSSSAAAAAAVGGGSCHSNGGNSNSNGSNSISNSNSSAAAARRAALLARDADVAYASVFDVDTSPCFELPLPPAEGSCVRVPDDGTGAAAATAATASELEPDDDDEHLNGLFSFLL
jgi:SHAQKYF class myb-like DNA-binding protein